MDSTALTRTFKYSSASHTFDVKWTWLGDEKAPPLVFIHGTPWSSRMWEPFALSLSRRFKVYLFDRPGFEDSPQEKPEPHFVPDNPATRYDSDLARQSEVFTALFKSWEKDWNGAKPYLVVHDNAGLLSLRAHLLHGLQYASLCLINVVVIGPFGQ